MKKLLAAGTVVILILYGNGLYGQSTFTDVYKVFKNNCSFSSCHDNDGPILGLDLQGAGPDSMMQVYDNIVNAAPANNYANGQGYKYITPGYPERSFIFRKAHNGLDPTIELHPNEGDAMPQFGSPLTEMEAEIIRQWILHGAPPDGQVVDTSVFFDYYMGNGVASVPNPPVPPADGEGFQLHLGPFFIPPGGEKEVFIKHDPMLDEDLEVTAVEVVMGNQSHHFILYKFFEEDQEFCGISTGGLGADDFPDGFRGIDLASHTSASFQVGAQNTERTDLPYNTAFFWDSAIVLDLNSHYINDNQNQVLGAEVYVNIYTQPSGTAAQEMEAIMIPNLDLEIPNDGQLITFTEDLPVAVCFPQGMYIWATTCHTHQLGQDYDIYKTDFGGNITDHIYDGSCFNDGVPGCATEFYDYQHPPTRVFEDFYHLTGADVIRHEASYINDGPEDVGWGFTSEDEMMLFFFFYVQDTAGLGMPANALPSAQDDTASTMQETAQVIAVLDNDIDPDGSLDPSSVTVLAGPANGSTTVNANGTITYLPDPGFFGTDEFTYVVCDDGSPVLCDTAFVTVTVSQGPSAVFGELFGKVQVYPNPTSGPLTITDPDGQIRRLELMTLQGSIVSEIALPEGQGVHNLDLSSLHLPAGTYLMIGETVDGVRKAAKLIYHPIH